MELDVITIVLLGGVSVFGGKGRLTGVIQAANGTSFPHMIESLLQVGRVLDADPNIVNAIEQIPSINGAAGTNSALMRVIPLAPNRKLNADEVARDDGKVRAQFDITVTDEAANRRRLLRRLAIDEIPVTTDSGIMDPRLRFFRQRETRIRK